MSHSFSILLTCQFQWRLDFSTLKLSDKHPNEKKAHYNLNIAEMRFYEKDQNSSSLDCKFGMTNTNKALGYLQGLSSVRGKRKCNAHKGN
jgi:hypothetical protein